jgi:hypothetical protein
VLGILDYERMALVIEGVHAAVKELARWKVQEFY